MNSLTVHPNSSNGHTLIAEPLRRPATSSASIFIADQDTFSRLGLRLLAQQRPGWTVVAATAVTSQAAAHALKLQPDIVLLGITEISGSFAEGWKFIQSLLQPSPNTRLLLLADQAQWIIEKAFAAGVLGYVPKQHADTELIPAVEALLQGRIFFSALAVQQLRAHYQQQSANLAILSRREVTIVRMIAQGNTSRETASALGISYRTVENHRAHIMQKLHFNSFAQLVRYAIREGIIEP